MPRREIKDERGSVWDVWDVKPGDAVARIAYDRRNTMRDEAADPAPADDPVDERPRSPMLVTPMLSAELEHGWLCFQSGSERRRFAPIPPNWPELPDGVLRVMLDVASPVGTPAQGTPQAAAPPDTSSSPG
jgi:hypothetical protein